MRQLYERQERWQQIDTQKTIMADQWTMKPVKWVCECPLLCVGHSRLGKEVETGFRQNSQEP